MVWLHTGEQLRRARISLNWTAAQLATRAGVSVVMIKRLERLRGPFFEGSYGKVILGAVMLGANIMPGAANTMPAPYTRTTQTGDQTVDGLLHTWKWAEQTLTFSFPTSASQYGSDYSAANEPAHGFQAMNATQKAAIREILEQVEGFTNMHFREVTETTSTHGTLRWGETTTIYDAETTSAWGYRPGRPGELGGDAWYNLSPPNAMYDSPDMGNKPYVTFMHELGHQLGLKHPQQTMNFGAMPEAYDNRNYTVMSYSRIGGNVQTFMQKDIAALQHMYGANYDHNSGDTTYKWNPSTGEITINGATSKGAPTVNKVLMTLWDGGGNDTYDFSAYTTALKVDLTPGGWTSLGTQHITGALGNIANAMLYKGDARSLIENVKGGAGNDTIVGNQAANRLDGGEGADTLTGGAGNDTFVLRKETTPDTITDATSGDKIDVTAWGISASQLKIVQDGTRWIATGDEADEKAYFDTQVSADQFVFSGTAPPTATPTPTPTDLAVPNRGPVR
jgi:serralysin